MSDADPKRPQPVSVEDWDDEAQASVPGTRTTANANVAVKRDLSGESDFPSSLVRHKHDGTDSGYVSKAPTVSSMASSGRRRNSELKLDTAVQVERERTPYTMTATPRETQRPPATRTAKDEDKKEQPKPVKKPFCHKQGICWVCDKYGFHFDPKVPPKDLLLKKQATKPAAPPAQPATQTTKSAVAKPKAEDIPRPPSRRMSSNQPRPTTLYAGTPVQTGAYPQYPTMHPGWATTAPPPGVVYAQYSYMAPSTPVNYMAPQAPNYFSYDPQPVFEEYPPSQPKPPRRLSMLNNERPMLEKKPSRTNTLLERTVSREQRPQLVSHKSNRNIDADKVAMPPPPAPQHATTVNAARPRLNRSNTYHANVPSNRRLKYEESDSESEEEIDARAMMAYRQPPASPRRPPSSYKPPTQEHVERPPLTQKAKSYQDGSKTVHVAKSSRAEAQPRRRATDSATSASIEAQEEAAEAYMRKRGSMPVVDLTAENLKTLKSVATRQVSDQRSESGSTNSHATHQSSSKGSSSGRGRMITTSAATGHSRGTSMNININGLNLNITDGGASNGESTPVRLDVGGVQISMNNRDKENIDYFKKPAKLLERTPSMSNRPSRRSLTQSSLVSAATNGQRREKDEMLAIEAAGRDSREYLRRPSYVDEEEREVLRAASAKSSRQPSRNASSVRQPVEEHVLRTRPQSLRSSVEYTRRDEPVM